MPEHEWQKNCLRNRPVRNCGNSDLLSVLARLLANAGLQKTLFFFSILWVGWATIHSGIGLSVVRVERNSSAT